MRRGDRYKFCILNQKVRFNFRGKALLQAAQIFQRSLPALPTLCLSLLPHQKSGPPFARLCRARSSHASGLGMNRDNVIGLVTASPTDFSAASVTSAFV